ncbi:MAG: phage antirepressor protein [Clostridiales bacterium]|jgi:anti-repressor protein|nr:phage antirepressor protein [Clostridiales bacterium]
MNDLITVNYNNDRQTVLGRELHEFLEVESNYTTWFKRMSEYGFVEGLDFITCLPNMESEIHGGQNKQDHQLTIEMAKEIAMIQRSDKGKEARQYFLQVERAWNSPEAVMARALKMADVKILAYKNTVVMLESKIEVDKPKVLFADSVTAASTSILVGDLAKLLKQNGIDIGEIRLWKWLRDNKYAIKERGHSYNMPTQISMDLKVMEIKEGTRINSLGESKITKTTLITGKGQVYFINKFLASKSA